MNLLIYTVIGLIVTWSLYLLYMYVATRASEGRSAQPLYQVFPTLEDATGTALVYCYSPRCGPCRPMSLEVDSMAAGGAPVFKLDISETPDVARELGVRATPTLIVVNEGTISRMILGARTARFMHQLIDAPPR